MKYQFRFCGAVIGGPVDSLNSFPDAIEGLVFLALETQPLGRSPESFWREYERLADDDDNGIGPVNDFFVANDMMRLAVEYAYVPPTDAGESWVSGGLR